MTSQLTVFHGDHTVGKLWLDDNQRWFFQYEPDWIRGPVSFPISARLPLQEPVFPPNVAKSFFVNLLPEGDVRKLIAIKFRISPVNDFALLSAIGGDCAGALSLYPPQPRIIERGNYRELTSVELARLVGDMRRSPLLTMDGKARLSLAGVQEKLPVYAANDKIFIPESGAPSSHILKPPMQRFEDSVQNELFCLRLARTVGLSVPDAGVVDGGKHNILIVARYDRKISANNAVERLHQEDFCQALGKLPEQKYQNEGGPSFADCFGVLEQFGIQPAVDKKMLIQWAVFNLLIGNCDAHAKNISLMISPSEIRLAPFYDLMSTVIYEDLDEKMAMKIGGQYGRDMVFGRHWERLADEVRVKPSIVLQILKGFSEELPGIAQKESGHFIAQYGGEKTINKIVKAIQTMAKRFE